MKTIIREEEERLNSIKPFLPIKPPLNNFMTDREREFFILGQKCEFEILTARKLK